MGANDTAPIPMHPKFHTFNFVTRLKPKKELYSIVGLELYISEHGRKDITCAVNTVAQHLANPTVEAMTAALHIAKYLNGTEDLSLDFHSLKHMKLLII